MARPITIVVNKEDLENLYLKKRLPLDLIANRFNCGERTIFNRLHEYGIPIRDDSERKDITKEKLEYLYIDKKMSIEGIAKVFKCGKNTVWSKISKHNIKIRTKSEALKGKYKINLPEEIKILYRDNKLSVSEIAKKFNCSTYTILRRLHRFDIPIRKERIFIDYQELDNLYSKEKLNIYQTGEKLGCTGVTILNRLRQYNIPTRKRGESAKGNYKIEISEEKVKKLYVDKKIPISKI